MVSFIQVFFQNVISLLVCAWGLENLIPAYEHIFLINKSILNIFSVYKLCYVPWEV